MKWCCQNFSGQLPIPPPSPKGVTHSGTLSYKAAFSWPNSAPLTYTLWSPPATLFQFEIPEHYNLHLCN